jgi:phenylalanyl-tRNA synthetase beta chain
VPPEELSTYPPLRVINPVSADHEYLRPVLRANVLRALAGNLRQHEGEVALFEAARTYLTEPDGGRPQEQEHIVGVVAGEREDRWGRASGEPVDFYDAKGYVEAALRALDIAAAFEEQPEFGMLRGRAAAIMVDGRRAGTIGQVHPDVAAAFEIDCDVFLFELIVDELLPSVPAVRRAEPVVRFPPVVEDLAVVVDKRVPAAQVRSLIEQHALVRSAPVFDVYEGDQIAANKKSLAFSVTYQSPDHTLDDKEVAKARQAIVARLKNELNAELRS